VSTVEMVYVFEERFVCFQNMRKLVTTIHRGKLPPNGSFYRVNEAFTVPWNHGNTL